MLYCYPHATNSKSFILKLNSETKAQTDVHIILHDCVTNRINRKTTERHWLNRRLWQTRGSYLCHKPSVAVYDGSGGRDSDAAVHVEKGAGHAAYVGRDATCVAVGADCELGAAHAGSVQHAVGADCVDYAGHVGCVGYGEHCAVGGAVCVVSRGQGGLGQDGRGAPDHYWQSGCWGGCWTGCLTSCSER